MQRIPWPQMQTREDDDDDDDEPQTENINKPPWAGCDTWVLNDQELPFLIDPDGITIFLVCIIENRDIDIVKLVTVTKITYCRPTGFETWITSDGRVYVVQLMETDDHYSGGNGLQVMHRLYWSA